MALVSGRRSTLNPDAPLFIPAAFRQVEDFSPEWWQLVTTSTWYRDYWLSQHQGEDGFYDNNTHDDDDDIEFDDVAGLLPDAFDFNAAQDYEDFIHSYETEVDNKSFVLPSNGLVKDAETQMNNQSMWKLMEERSPRPSAEPAKYADKAAKAMNPRSSPRRIQQPR